MREGTFKSPPRRPGQTGGPAFTTILSHFCGLFVSTCVVSVRAALAPYVVDADTLHLWHLNEAGAPALDAVAGGTSLNGLLGGATLGNGSFGGFGTGLRIAGDGQLLLAAPALSGSSAGSGADSVNLQMADAATGAFTWEALLRLDFDPVLPRPAPMQIICGEGEGSAGAINSDRQWQFRLDPVGFPGPAGSDITRLRIEFHNFNGIGFGNPVWVNVPNTGDHAAVSNSWFHLAVVYNGNEGTPDNMSFYWTRFDPTNTAANLIGSVQMPADLIIDNNGATGGAINTDFSIGNEARATFGETEPFIGLIDEVRISSLARAATNFYWPTVSAADVDLDGLPDAWEVTYFGDITTYGATNDPDGDLFDNLAEYTGGSNPTNILSTPLDTDGDGLPDVWEQTYFGSLGQTATDDDDGDTFTNLEEYLAGTDPTLAASNPEDTDADGLPDAWENLYFGSLAASPWEDSDGDGYFNVHEYQNGSLPNDPHSVPKHVLVRFFPVEDGDPVTSEYGYAGNGSGNINAVSFTRSALSTVSNLQFMAYYYRHATNPGDPDNNHICIARRDIHTNIWEIFHTPFMANDINDDHDVVSFGIDGEGYMHISWGMHGDAFHYSQSLNPVTGSVAITFGADTTMTGGENNATYPQFLTLPDGDLLYLFREGVSGDGDTYLNRFSLSTHTWSNVHFNGVQQPFILGSPWFPDYNAYPNMPQLSSDGTLYLTWTWRYQGDSPAGEVGYQTNHDFDYARSTNGGLTWLRQNGTPYALPINQSGESGNTNSIAEEILSISEGSSLINQASMCLDQWNLPVIASWWAPGAATNNQRRQYMVTFPDENDIWQTRQISHRTNDPVDAKMPESRVRELGRPVVVADKENRLIVLYRDNFDGNGITVAFTPPRALDPERTHWHSFDLTGANLGLYEPQIDWERWKRDNVLEILYQPFQGLGYVAPANQASQIGVLEWDAAAFFAHRPTLSLAVIDATNASLSFNAQVGWDYRVQTSTNLAAWETLATLPGIAGQMRFVQTNAFSSGQGYWRLESQEGGFTP